MDLFRNKKSGQDLSLRRQAEEASVHLAFLMAEAHKVASSILHGEHRQRKAGPGERFWQFREYIEGDRPQDIDWRQSGKNDRIFIRQHEWQTNQACYLWCAKTPGMDFCSEPSLPTKGDAAKIITLALGILLTHGGEEIGVLGDSRKGRSEAALQRLAETLQNSETTGELPQGFSAQKNRSLILTGDFLSPPEDIEQSFKNLSTTVSAGFIIQILDPAELSLPYDGRVVFETPGTQMRELVNNVSSIREAYQARMTAHLKAVQAIARNCHFHYLLHRTDENISDTLLKVWNTISMHTSRAGTLQR